MDIEKLKKAKDRINNRRLSKKDLLVEDIEEEFITITQLRFPITIEEESEDKKEVDGSADPITYISK